MNENLAQRPNEQVLIVNSEDDKVAISAQTEYYSVNEESKKELPKREIPAMGQRSDSLSSNGGEVSEEGIAGVGL